MKLAGRTLAILAAGALAAPSIRAQSLIVPDFFPTIQAAIDAAGPGDDVLVRAGVYEESLVISGKTGLTLRGEGKVLLRPGIDDIGIDVETSSNMVLENLSVDRASVSILGSQVNAFTVRNCSCADYDIVGIEIVISAGALVVEDCDMHGRGFGVVIFTPDEPGTASVTGNHVDSLVGGIFVQGIPVVTVSGNELRSVAVGEFSSVVANIQIQECNAAADFDVQVTSNHTEGGRGILVQDSVGVVIFGNELVSSTKEGVRLENADNATVAGNLITGGRDSGVFVDSQSNKVLVAANTLKKVRDAGLRIVGPSATVSNNTIIKCAFDGLRFEGDDGLCTGNTFTGCGRVALFLAASSSGVIVSGNAAKGSRVFDLFDESGDELIEDDNSFGTTGP